MVPTNLINMAHATFVLQQYLYYTRSLDTLTSVQKYAPSQHSRKTPKNRYRTDLGVICPFRSREIKTYQFVVDGKCQRTYKKTYKLLFDIWKWMHWTWYQYLLGVGDTYHFKSHVNHLQWTPPHFKIWPFVRKNPKKKLIFVKN